MKRHWSAKGLHWTDKQGRTAELLKVSSGKVALAVYPDDDYVAVPQVIEVTEADAKLIIPWLKTHFYPTLEAL